MSQNDYPTDSLPIEQLQQIHCLADQFERESRASCFALMPVIH